MNILKYLIAFGLCAIMSTASAERIYQINTSLGLLSLSKKNLKEELEETWVVKLDNKTITEFIKQLDAVSFMTMLGNGEEFYSLPKGVSDKVAIVDSEGELMAAIVQSSHGNACNGGSVSVFFFQKSGASKLLEVPGGECTVVNKITVQGKKLILDVAEFAKPLVFESGQLKTLAVPAPPVKMVYEDLNAAEKAFKCVKEAREECPYFSEVYKGDAGFRESLDSALKESGFTNPVLGDDSMESPTTPIVISGEPYIYDDTWRKFSDNPGSDKIEVLYSLQKKRAVGLFYVEDSEKGKWFGNPTDLEKRVLDEAKSHSGSNPIGKAVSEGPYPVIVK